MALSKAEILKELKARDVHFLRLQFSDILGITKNVEVPASQFEKALDGAVAFDGSSIEGFARAEEEADMLLVPDYQTFLVFPDRIEDPSRGRVARLIADVHHPDGRPFAGDPRLALKGALEELRALGFERFNVGPEPEFFLFLLDERGKPTTVTHDQAGYFDLAPVDKGEEARRDMVNALVEMGFEIEAAHHEVAPGQHEIDFKYADALKTADNIATFKFVVKRVALQHGLHATFMPKPIQGLHGSGLHVHLSLTREGKNVFFDETGPYQLSKTALGFIAGLLEHASGLLALTNPTVNSYKRLTPGFEAPTNVAWSASNRTAMIRIPAKRGESTRAELRTPDPSANPYLALTATLAAGLDGVRRDLEPPPPIQRNIAEMSVRDRRRHKIKALPLTLREALDALERDEVLQAALGRHIYKHFLKAKREEWQDYRVAVHAWEIERYLTLY